MGMPGCPNRTRNDAVIGSEEEPWRSSRHGVGTPDGTDRGRRLEEGAQELRSPRVTKRHRGGPGAQAPCAVVRQPSAGAQEGRRRPESRGARRSRAKRPRSRHRPGEGWKAGPPDRTRGAPSGHRLGPAELQVRGHRRVRCRGDAGGPRSAWPRRRSPHPLGSPHPLPRPGKARHGRRANRHSSPRLTARSPRRRAPAAPRSRRSGEAATGSAGMQDAWPSVRFRGADGSRLQGPRHQAANPPPSGS